MAGVLPISIVMPVRKIDDQSLELWMQVREEGGPLNGFLEFPGGKIEAGETPQAAAVREVVEEVGISLKEEELKHLKIHNYTYKDRKVSLYVYFTNALFESDKGEWIAFDFVNKTKKYTSRILEANGAFIDQFIDYIAKEKAAGNMELVWAK